MTICKYYLEGRCKFGDSCRDEHRYPGNQRYNNQESRYNHQSRNDIYNRIRYGQNQNNLDNPQNQINKPYDERSVKSDLTKDRPMYPFSAYGPAKDEYNLIDGTDYSPEELRLQYYTIMGTFGNDMSYQSGVRDLESRMQTKVDAILRDTRPTLNRFESQSKQQRSSTFGSYANGNAFGQPQPPQPPRPSPFPQSQTFGAPQNSFGAYTANQPSAFGAPSGFGQNPNPIGFPSAVPAFGAPAFGGGGSNQSVGTFGSTVSPFGAFGQPQPQPQPDPQQLYQQQQLEMLAHQQQLLLQQQQQQQQQQQFQQLPSQFMDVQQQQQQQQPSPMGFSGQTNNSQRDWDMYKVPEMPPSQESKK